jgi:hypothetical protein
MARTPSDVYADAVDRLISAASADDRIRALWLEGATQMELRRPYRQLRVHLACDEPHFAALEGEVERMLAGPAALAGPRWSDVPRFARQLEATLEGQPVTLCLEKSSLLAKRPRAAVLALVDKTGHLPHVMDFSRAQPS